MSRQEQLDAINSERAAAEQQAKQDRDAVEPVTQIPFLVNQDSIPVVLDKGLSGSLTRLADGQSYLVEGNSISILLQSNGPITISSTAPEILAGGDGEIQYNNSNDFSGDPAFSFNDTTNTLTTTNITSSLTRLVDGSSYIIAGENIFVSSGSDGSISVFHTSSRLPGFETLSAILADERSRGQLDALSISTGARKSSLGIFGFSVSCVEPDGLGGAFIGGTFTGGQAQRRFNIAHLDSSGSISSWDLALNNTVNSLKLSGSTLFAGGAFTRAGHVMEDTWSYNLDNGDLSNDFNITGLGGAPGAVVRTAELPDGSFIIGGSFLRVLGQDRPKLAKIKPNGELDLQFNPKVEPSNSVVYSLQVSGSSLYFGGNFTSVNNAERNRLAAVDLSTGELLNFNPDVNGLVLTTAVSGSNLYFGGGFTTVGGTTRNRLAAVDTTTGNLNLTFDPDVGPVNTIVSSIAVSGSNLYFGGTFTTVGVTNRNRLAAVDTTTGNLNLTFNPNVSSTSALVNSIAVSGSNLYFGGAFTTVGVTTRNRIAAVDTTTGNLNLTFDPNASSTVRDIAVSGSNLYVVGEFTSVGGLVQERIGAVNTATGTGVSLGVHAGVAASSVNIIKNKLYASQNLTITNSRSVVYHTDRPRLAALNANYRKNYDSKIIEKNQVLSFNPGPTNTVRALEVSGSNLYVGGDYTTINGVSAQRISAVDTITGNTNATFVQNVNDSVRSLLLSGSNLYMGGLFSTLNVGGSTVTRRYIAAVDSTTGAVQAFDANIPSSGGGAGVLAMALSGSNIYLGGQTFTTVGGQSRISAAAVDTTTGNVQSFNPKFTNATLYSLLVSGSNLYVGGNFPGLNVSTISKAAIINEEQTTLSDLYVSGTRVNTAVRLDDGSTVFAGLFTSVQSTTRNNIAKVDATGVLDLTFNPGTNSEVNTLVVSGSNIYLGGAFTGVGGGTGTTTRNRIAAVDSTNGTVDTSFNPGANGTVFSMISSGSKIYLGGTFTGVGGGTGTTTRNRIAAVDSTNGAVDTSFNPGTVGGVRTLAVSGSNIFLGGDFTTVGGGTGTASSRSRVAAVDSTDGTVQQFNPGIGSQVNTLVVSGSTLYAGGNFTAVSSSISRNYMAAFNIPDWKTLSFNPVMSSFVISIAASGSNLYVVGGAGSAAEINNRSLVVLDSVTGIPKSGSFSLDGTFPATRTVIPSGSTVFIGGEMTTAAQSRSNLAIVDSTTGNLLPARVDVAGTVNVLMTGSFFGEDMLLIGGTNTTPVGSAPAMTISDANTIDFTPPFYFGYRPVIDNGIMKLIFRYSTDGRNRYPGVGNYVFTLPPGFKIDTSVAPVGSVASYTSNFDDAMALGVGSVRGDFVGGGGAWAVVPINSKQLVLVGKDPASSETVTWGANNFPLSNFDMKVNFVATIPVIETDL